MTDAEIINALECHTGIYKGAGCVHCSFTIYGCDCRKTLNRASLDLINRQKAEIERLKEENHHFADLGKMYSEIKAEAIKEFAQRLKENTIDVDVSYGYGREHYTEAVAVVEIDNLAKEMAVSSGSEVVKE